MKSSSRVRGHSPVSSKLLIMEAMKMEHTIMAPNDGKVTTVNFQVGDMVEEGTELLVVA
ncbi:MAG: acetyl-CoA carboxylase biotin carboxyl carrier protein subunit [Woeseia sp.]|nr:acetyl-CoA carboxylase biotin carboxyl carrier protein subunit [Woeseia sp.]MBT6210983.1 acetyl-CoA carboxylase biotin carboxyl carrier protein subunit [Woeseia sp.]